MGQGTAAILAAHHIGDVMAVETHQQQLGPKTVTVPKRDLRPTVFYNEDYGHFVATAPCRA
jgi:hypothetical protein